ncbi:MAG: thiamine phosphate synthase [Clostridiales bacterium]|nr:thiamine phosphate synthase [Clostridiales bacterium]
MKIDKNFLRLYAVTDRAWTGRMTLAGQVEAAISGGATMIQLREKNMEEADFEAEAREILAVCRRCGVPMIVNDNVGIAERVGADGVHVGQTDMDIGQARRILGPDKIIGATAKTVGQARAAEAAGADYLGSGALFGSTTKADARPMEREILMEIVKSVDIPVVAIGGINSQNADALIGTGIAGIAVVSGIFAADDIKSETAKLREIAERL